jgi:hypothetical protein
LITARYSHQHLGRMLGADALYEAKRCGRAKMSCACAEPDAGDGTQSRRLAPIVGGGDTMMAASTTD